MGRQKVLDFGVFRMKNSQSIVVESHKKLEGVDCQHRKGQLSQDLTDSIQLKRVNGLEGRSE